MKIINYVVIMVLVLLFILVPFIFLLNLYEKFTPGVKEQLSSSAKHEYVTRQGQTIFKPLDSITNNVNTQIDLHYVDDYRAPFSIKEKKSNKHFGSHYTIPITCKDSQCVNHSYQTHTLSECRANDLCLME